MLTMDSDQDTTLTKNFSNLRKRKRPPSELRFRKRHKSEDRSSSSSDRGSSCRRKFDCIPTSTDQWDNYVLERLGINYNIHFHSSPCDILDLIYRKTGIFGPLSQEQNEYVKNLQDSITYSSSITNLLSVMNMINVDTFIPEMKKDIDSIRNRQNSSYVEDFINSTRLMINYQVQHLTQGDRKGPVPEDVFVDMFKSYVKMCGLLPVPGSVWKSSMCIHSINVQSESDVVIMPKDHLDDTSPDPVSVVSIVEVQNSYRQGRVERPTKTRPSRSPTKSSLESIDSEPSVHQEPAIFEIIGHRLLGQHGGELLTHNELYGDFLSRRRAFKYLPGMIVIGTEVIFTVLAINGDHINELMKRQMSDKNKSYIYYSEPKDLLKKEDRDMLIESFVRLSNKFGK